MIIGFSGHGTGGSSGPLDYLLDPNREGREGAPPTVVRGNEQQTARLIDSLEFQWKYTSGVLSFSPGERITPEMETEIMDRFEEFAFAGLDRDQYDILWVRHSHAGHHEIHFVVPRVELETGHSMNIKPPGSQVQDAYDDLRSEINSKYGLSSPDDPKRARLISRPDHELKQEAAAMRRGETPRPNDRVLIDQILMQRVQTGLIKNRDDLVSSVREMGLDFTRQGRDYVTITDPDTGSRWKMKGGIYEREFSADTAFATPVAEPKRDYSKPCPEAAAAYSERVEKHIERRAEYNQRRYPRSVSNDDLENVQIQNPDAVVDRDLTLSGAIRRQLGADAIPGIEDHRDAENDKPAGVDRRGRDPEAMREPSMRAGRSDGEIRRELHGDRGVLNSDKLGNSVIERIRRTLESVRSAASGVAAGAVGIAQNVRDYLDRKRRTETPGRSVERSINQFEQASRSMKTEAPKPSNSPSPSGPSF